MKNQIKQHEDNYWHIPKLSIMPLLGLILFTLLAIGNFQLIDKEVIKEVFKNCENDCVYNLVPKDLINIYPIIGEYILISLAIISLVALLKKGYRNLKSYDEDALIFALTTALIRALTLALILALIRALTTALFGTLIGALIGGLILTLILALIGALIGGLIGGLIGEFEE